MDHNTQDIQNLGTHRGAERVTSARFDTFTATNIANLEQAHGHLLNNTGVHLTREPIDSPRENALNPSPSNVCSAVAAPASIEIEMVLQMNVQDIQHMPVWFVRVWLCA